jgi:2-succinyl-6-hydroxy-2,4-cyclohexadiene-1-carboxylate synthase
MITLLLHGFSGDRTSWDEVGARWQPQQPRESLASRLAIDLPGHGGGQRVRVGWRANLEAIGDEVGPSLREATVVGYSLGARVALGLVAEGLARRAVLVSVNPGLASGSGSSSEPSLLAAERARAERRASDARWAALLREQGVAVFAERWAAQGLFASQAVTLDAAARQRRLAQRLAQSAEGLARSLEEMGLAEMPDYRGELARLADRLTLVVGELDAKFRALGEEMAAAASVPLHVIPQCGHDVPLEQPRALAELLSRLLDAPT